MTEEERRKIISNDYTDAIVERRVDYTTISYLSGGTVNYINETFAIIYFPVTNISQNLENESSYAVVPKIFGLLDTTNLEDLGVTRLQNNTTLDLRGEGVLLGFVDTGIDYTNPIFKNDDNTTRIISIWDQTIENMEASEDIFFYGTEYTREQINAALASDNPLSIVPTTDEVGHGTTLAGLVGGSAIPDQDFVGIATASDFVVVKLKEAKQKLKEFFFVPPGVNCYQENDIMTGVTYLDRVAQKLNRPIVICVGLGTNMGGHDGRSPLSLLLSNLGEQNGVVIVTAAGNEGNAGHHYFGLVDPTVGFDTVELRVAEGEKGFIMELWGQVPGIYSVDILSPTGEYIPRIPARLRENREINFLFEQTTVFIYYLIVEAQTGDQLIFIRFLNPAPGIWRFRVYGGGDITSGFHIWLPMSGFIKPDTVFVRPNPDTTITTPGNASIPITVTAYNHRNESLYLRASRGYSRSGVIKPEVTAPGVDIFAPSTNQSFANVSGTSYAAAQASGVCALLLEWGIVRGNFTFMDTVEAKKFLIRGVRRTTDEEYPNREWGFGIIDIYRTFSSLRGES